VGRVLGVTGWKTASKPKKRGGKESVGENGCGCGEARSKCIEGWRKF